MRGPATNTAIERRMQDALRKAGIGFTAQSLMLGRYLVDIEVHQAPVIVEADGAQHALRAQKAKDAIRDTALEAAGYRVFRFTGSEINADAVACVRRMIGACGLIPDRDPVFEIRTAFAGASHPNWKGGEREFTCESCSVTFLAKPSQRKGRHVYCSRECHGKGQVGIKRGPHSAEHRARISASRKRYYQTKVESDLRGDAQRAAEMTAPAALVLSGE